MTGGCINCGDPDASPYDLLVRSTSHEAVLLCETCHEAIQREMAEEA
jgi:predicted CXXCH cytochrome family protein